MLTNIRFKPALAPAGIILAAFLAFGLTLKTGFMWDDHRMIEQNPRLAPSAANFASAFRGDPFDQGLNYYRPLQTVSNMADFALWGYRPFGYHLTNLAFHAAGAVLFFYLALALGFGRRASFWAAALLAAHPAAVEQLLIVAGRAELASSACVLASLLLFVRGGTGLSFVLFLAAAGFKENGVITPALAALCLWYLRRDKKEYLKLLPFFIFIPVYLLIRREALGMGALSTGVTPVLSGLFLKVPQTVAVYLKEAVFPFDMHSHRMQPFSPLLRFLSLPALAAAGFLIWRRGGRTALFCAAWYLLNLAPKLPLLATNDLMLDHWVYLANAGIFLWAAALLENSIPRRRALLPAAAAVLIAASAFNTTLRDTDLKIYENAARSSSSKPMLYNLAREYYLGSRLVESRAILEKISAAEPGNAIYLNGLALARLHTGDAAGALAAIDAALAAKPGDAETLYNKYCIQAASGRREAAGTLALLLKTSPGYAPALLAMAREKAAAGHIADAAVFYEKLLSANPYDLEGLNDYGVLLARAGKYPEAGVLFRRALKVSPGLPSARQNLDRLEKMEKGKPGRT